MRTSEKPDLRKFVDEVLIKKRNSPKFAVAISDVSSPMKPPSCRVERDHPRSPPHVATNGARKRSKLLRLATGRLPENFGVLRTSRIRLPKKFVPPRLRNGCRNVWETVVL